MLVKTGLASLAVLAMAAMFFLPASGVSGARPSDHEGAPLTAAPVVTAPVASPALPVAGSTFTVSHVVTTSDTGAVLTAGQMICDPSINGAVLTHAESFAGGIARLHFAIPASAGGKLLKVHVTIRLGKRSMTRESFFYVLPRLTGLWSYKPLP